MLQQTMFSLFKLMLTIFRCQTYLYSGTVFQNSLRGTCDQRKYEGYGLGHLHSALKHPKHQNLWSDSLSSLPLPFSPPAFTLNATLETYTRNQYKLPLCPSFSSHHLPALLIQLCFLSWLSLPSSSTVATIIISLLNGCNKFPKELSCL